MKINLHYRTDRRIKVVEVRTGNKIFMADLEVFAIETGIVDYDPPTGTVAVDLDQYQAIWQGRIQSATPHSFRFRKAKGASKDS